MSGMRTILKDLKTGLLFRHMDQWTSEIEEAAYFKDTLSALKFCQRNNLSDVAIFVVYPDPSRNRVAGFYRHRHGAVAQVENPPAFS